jgi:hypothetical protein
MNRKILLCFGILVLSLAGCFPGVPQSEPAIPVVPEVRVPVETEFGGSPRVNIVTPQTPTEQAALITTTATYTPAFTPTASRTPTTTLSPTTTSTPTITPTPTFDFPDFTVKENQANCRYGPGTAYLYAAGLYAGDHAEVRGRNYSGTWLYLKPDKIDYFCWAAASVGEVTGDVFSVLVWQRNLPKTTFVGPVELVSATRNGDLVTVVWEPVQVNPPEDARGYLIEAVLCQGGNLFSTAVHTEDNQFTFTDERTCNGASSANIFVVEKHGYTDPVSIPWP